MWLVGDWGQAEPWSRTAGVKMVKGANDVYTGELSLPKGTKFDIKILKSTVSTPYGGDNTWSAVRYASILNTSTSHDFGEFIENLIPNGNFEKGNVNWDPPSIVKRDYANSEPYVNTVFHKSVSDVFAVPANQSLRLAGYVYHFDDAGGIPTVIVESVEPQQRTLLKLNPVLGEMKSWHQFSGWFKSGDTPMKCRIMITTDGDGAMAFDTLSLVNP